MFSIWNHSTDASAVTLEQALQRLAMVAGRANESIEESDLVSKINFYTRMLYVHTYKNKLYGDAWNDPDMGFRLNLAFVKSKFGRLLELAWKGNKDFSAAANKPIVEKTVETIHDLANYLFFIARMIEIEFGVDYSCVREQCIEADYEDLDLEGISRAARAILLAAE